jgi:hypothetical protein
MLHALCVIAFAVLFSGSPVGLCCIFVKFSGFVVIVICHVGSLSSAPSAQQHAGLQPVPRVTEWCDKDLQKSSIKILISGLAVDEMQLGVHQERKSLFI